MLPSVPAHPHRPQVWRGHPGGLLSPRGARLGTPYEARRVPGFWGGAVGRRGSLSESWRWQPSAWLPAPFGGPRAAAQPPPPSRQLLAGIFRYRPVLSASQMSPGAGVPSRPPPLWQLSPVLPVKPPPAQAWGGCPQPPCPLGVVHGDTTHGRSGTHMGTQRREPPRGDNGWGRPERVAPPCPETPGAWR